MGIYDNGYKVLGRIVDIKEYICRNCDSYEDVKDIIEDLEDYDSDTIVVIDYDNSMGYHIDCFMEKDKVRGYE